MAYTFDKASATAGDLIPTGDYEAQIEKIEQRQSPTSGRGYLNIQYRIRSDVEQECKNRVVFEAIWTEKDAPEFYNRKRLNQLMGTQDFKDGQTFDSAEDLIQALVGSCLIIHIAKEFDDYSGKDRNQVKWYRSSKAKPTELKPADTDDINVVDDDGVPF